MKSLMKIPHTYGLAAILALLLPLLGCQQHSSRDIVDTVGDDALDVLCIDLEDFVASAGLAEVAQLPHLPLGASTHGINTMKKFGCLTLLVLKK